MQWRRNLFAAQLLIASLPALALFVMIPMAIYLPNQAEFDHNVAILLPYAVLFGVWVLAIGLLFWRLEARRRDRLAVILFYVGLFLLLSDVISPVQLTEIQGEQTPGEPLLFTVAELALAIGIVTVGSLIPARATRAFGSAFVLIVSAGQIFTIGRELWPQSHFNNPAVSITTIAPPPLSPKRSIYHLTWDAYSGIVFEKLLREAGLAGSFDGFVFFKNTRANYLHTMYSRASFMTGTFYRSGSVRQWLSSANQTGLVQALHERGFATSMYVREREWRHRLASHVSTNVEAMKAYDSLSDWIELADLWLVRAVPNFLQDDVFVEGRGVIGRWGAALRRGGRPRPQDVYTKPFSSVLLARQLIADEQNRPAHGQYVYAHFYLPHFPYVMNAECAYAQEAVSDDMQTTCATRLMADFLNELKRLGRYTDATIVLQSDHGPLTLPALALVRRIGGETNSDPNVEVLSGNNSGFSPTDTATQSRALLAIKPPGSSGTPLEISELPTQLADVGATILHLIDGDESDGFSAGKSVFSTDFPRTREVDVFLTYPHGKVHDEKAERGFGTRAHPGRLNHFSFSATRGWMRHPDIAAHY